MEKVSLKRSITFIEASAIVIGVIIGSGIFLKPSIVLNNAGSHMMGIMAWIVGGIITLASALTVAEIASAIPKSGGLYTYLEDLYGKPVGFLLGWVQSIISYPASIAAQSIAFAAFANAILPIDPSKQKILAVSVLLFILIMNIISTKCGGVIQVVATIGKLVPVVAIIVFGLAYSSGLNLSVIDASVGGAGFGAAILGTLWAYDGWIGVANMGGEIKNSSKNLPRVITFGVVFVIIIYVAINLAIYKVVPFDELVATETPGADAAIKLFGTGGAMFLTIGIMVSVFGSLNGYLMTGSRVPQAMGSRRELPFSKTLGKVNPKLKTPINALIFQAAVALIYVFTGTFNTLTDLLVFVLWIFFTLGVIGIFILRKKRKPEKGKYKVPLYPITPIIGIVGGLYILVNTIVDTPVNSLIGIGITLVGIPVYAYIQNKNKKQG